MKPPDLIGKKLFGEYTVVDYLASGAIGAVYLARHESIGKEIAVKVLHERSSLDDETVARFEREAEAISLLTHPNIIRVLVFGRTDEGQLFLAMEYVKGMPLSALKKKAGVDELRLIRIFKQLCSALEEAHEMGIVHRDLKPENVLLTEWRGEGDFVKILDFGMAKFTEDTEERRRLSKSGIVYGTPAYISPEQAQAIEVDHRADIYSLGCILYELVTGQLPYLVDTAVKMLSAHVNEPLVAPGAATGGAVSPGMEAIIMKAMAKKRSDRFGSAREMGEALEAYEQELLAERERPPEVPAKQEKKFGPEDVKKIAVGAAIGATMAFVAMGLLALFILMIR